MEYINLGTSGLKVSRTPSLGMMTYGSPKWRPWVLEYGIPSVYPESD